MIFFECYADETLLRSLGLSAKELSGGHSFGRSNVSRKLAKLENSIGMIDEDPGSARDSYLEMLLSVKPIYEDKFIIYAIDAKRSNKLIVIKPDLEGMIIHLALDMKIDLNSYGLTSIHKNLGARIKLQKNRRDRNLLANFLLQTSGHPTIQQLKKILNQ